MSYILEALKKAQAERQLGALPSIHTPPSQAAPESSGKPWWLALGVALALLLLLLLWLQSWRTAPVPAPALVQAPEVIAAPKVAAAPDVARAPSVVASSKVAQTPEVEQRPKVASVSVPKAAPVPQSAPAPKAVVPVRADARPAEARPGSVSGAVSGSASRQPVSVDRAPAVAPAVASAVASAVAPVQAAEEAVPALRALPESIQRQIPVLVLGGYIYSRNPQDRLLLIDKTLRREGEQVAPGLILETLRPTSAIFNYNGSRYQMAY